MSIVVAVRVRPTYDAATTTTPGRALRRVGADSNVLDDPTVCGALRFVRDTHITFTQEAMEALEADRLEAAALTAASSAAPVAVARATSARRSHTPPTTRSSQELHERRGQSPVVSRGSGTVRRVGPSPVRSSSSSAPRAVAAHPLPQPSTKTRFARPVFEFDCCFSSESDHLVYGTQADVYERLGAPLLQRFLLGYNCCLMAYGQTGSGKTYSMFGPHADELADVQRHRALTSTSSLPPRHVPGISVKSTLVRRLQFDEDRGIIFRLLEECFADMKRHKETERRASLSALRSPSHAQDAADAMVNFDVEVTYYQVYREKVYCLLTGSHQSSFAFDANCQSLSAVKSLRVRESVKNGPYVEGLKSVPVKSLEEAVELLDVGNKNRRVASTSQNIHSSRSHAVLALRLRCIRSSEDASFTSIMNLVDLAGSERAAKTSEPSLAYASTFSSAPRSSARLSETSDINRSLSTLGKVIHVLAAKASAGGGTSPPRSATSTARGTARSHPSSQQNTSTVSIAANQHVPYRESTLTFLLRDSLGGNSSTTILSTISPMLDDVAETLSTLRYASKARHIINTPVVNTDAKSAMLVNALRDEVQHLRQQLQVSLSAGHQRELEAMMDEKQRQLDEYETEMVNMSQERSSWELEKVSMMERVVVLEHEADALRGELSAAIETADEYRAKLEQLTLLVDSNQHQQQRHPHQSESEVHHRRNSGHAAVVPDQRRPLAAAGVDVVAAPGSGGVQGAGTTLLVVAPPSTNIALSNNGSASSSRRGSGVFAQTNPPAAAAQASPGLTSRAIVFAAASRSASPPVPPPPVVDHPPLRVPTSPPTLNQEDMPTLTPRSFVSGAKAATATGSGIWSLPEKYQWLLAPSRSDSSRQSSMQDDEDDATDAAHQHRHTHYQKTEAPPAVVEATQRPQMQFEPPPPLGTPRGGSRGSSRKLLTNAAAYPIHGGGESSDDEDLPRLDNDSFLEAARSAGIDVLALLDAKKREKSREKKKRRSREGSKASDDAPPKAAPSMLMTTALPPRSSSSSTLMDQKMATAVPLLAPMSAAPTSHRRDAVEVPRLPPPSFARNGRSPPQLGQDKRSSLTQHPNHHLSLAPQLDHKSGDASIRGAADVRRDANHSTTRSHHIDAASTHYQPVAVPPAITKFQQKLRDQTPPNLKRSTR